MTARRKTQMPEILDRTSSSILVRQDDGRIEQVSLSPRNRLLFDHGLWDFFKKGDEILTFQDGVKVISHEKGDSFTIVVDNDPLHLGEHHISDLSQAIFDVYSDENRDTQPIIEMYRKIRENQIRYDVLNSLLDYPLFDSVEKTEDGWLFHDKLLLSWEGEFYHPGTTSRTVSGRSIAPSSNDKAYRIRTNIIPDDMDRKFSIGDETYRLSDREMEFIAKALWAIQNAPR